MPTASSSRYTKTSRAGECSFGRRPYLIVMPSSGASPQCVPILIELSPSKGGAARRGVGQPDFQLRKGAFVFLPAGVAANADRDAVDDDRAFIVVVGQGSGDLVLLVGARVPEQIVERRLQFERQRLVAREQRRGRHSGGKDEAREHAVAVDSRLRP